jgi:HK97 family phage prohead protease/HK97 family phage major capsid protein
VNTRVTPGAVVAQEFNGRRLRALIAAESLDRQSEVLLATGVELENYRRNPVILWNHDANTPPIGRAVSLEIEPGVGLWADNEFAPTPFAAELFELYRGGYLNAFSVGFRPLETERKARRAGQTGATVLRWELVEQSAVAVPANPDALVVAAAEGNRAAQWLLKTYYPAPEHGVPAQTISTESKGDTMDQIVSDLYQIAQQIKRDHDPDKLQRAIADVVTRAPGAAPGRLAALDAAGSDGPTLSLKEIMGRRARNQRELELQRLNDRVFLASTLLRRDPRTLKSYDDFQKLSGELHKALDTVDNAAFVPASFSVSLIEEVRLQRRLPLLFENVLLPRSPLQWPVEGGIGLPFLVGEATSDTPSPVPTTSPGTNSVTFAARTIGVRVPFSQEFDEDSIVAAEDYVRRQIAKALNDGLETAILNGDNSSTHMDSIVTAANDVRRTFCGLRKLAKAPTAATETNCATYDQQNWVAVRQKMGAYGIDPNELVCIMGVKSYYKVLGDDTNWGDFQTLEKVGPQAINLTGEVGALYGVPIVVSAYMPETCGTSAVDDGTGTNSMFVLANRRAYGLATQVGATIETHWDPECLQYKVIGHQRVDFKPWFDATSQLAVSVGWDVSVA